MAISALGELYLAFFRIGGLTFGGGLTMLPMLKHELVAKKGWVSEDELLDCYAIGQCTPGVIAVNTATFVGYKREGIAGGIAATLGMISPSVVLITLIASFFQAFVENTYFQHAIMGIKGVVCALMLNTVITLAKKSLVNSMSVLICAVALALALFTPVPTIAVVVLAGLSGAAMELWRRRHPKEGGRES